MKLKEYLKNRETIRKCEMLLKLTDELCKFYNSSPTNCVGCPAYLYSHDEAKYFCAHRRVLKQMNKVWLGVEDDGSKDGED